MLTPRCCVYVRFSLYLNELENRVGSFCFENFLSYIYADKFQNIRDLSARSCTVHIFIDEIALHAAAACHRAPPLAHIQLHLYKFVREQNRVYVLWRAAAPRTCSKFFLTYTIHLCMCVVKVVTG